MTPFIKTAAALAFGTAAFTLGVAAPAAAQEAPSISVSYAELNLSSERGTEVFDRRIKNAISNVCGGAERRGVAARRIYSRCMAQTAESVQPKRDLAIAAYRDGRLASKERVIRFAAQ